MFIPMTKRTQGNQPLFEFINFTVLLRYKYSVKNTNVLPRQANHLGKLITFTKTTPNFS
jgi:hypothetical protein